MDLMKQNVKNKNYGTTINKINSIIISPESNQSNLCPLSSINCKLPTAIANIKNQTNPFFSLSVSVSLIKK